VGRNLAFIFFPYNGAGLDLPVLVFGRSKDVVGLSTIYFSRIYSFVDTLLLT
jgi:hypothetical protein